MRRYFGLIGVLTFIALASAALGQVTTTSSSGGTTFDGTSVTAQGTLLLPAGTCGTVPGWGWSADNDGTGTGMCRNNQDIIDVTLNGVRKFNFSGSRLGVTNGLPVVFTNSTTDPNTTASLSVVNDSNTTGSLRIFSGTTPTQSGTTCGTGPTIAGNNTSGSVILGSSPGLPCTIVFNGTWTSAPKCYLNPEVLTTGTTTVRATGITTGQFVITSTAALVATDKVSWFCTSS